MKLLIVSDGKSPTEELQAGLAAEDVHVDVAPDQARAEDHVAASDYDAILVDVTSVGIDGFGLCQRWREDGITVPILFLAGRDAIPDRVRGLESGGDDFVVKPFAVAEVLARVRALMRRPRVVAGTPELRVGELRIDTVRRRVQRGVRTIALSTREYELLEYLVRHTGDVVSRTALWRKVWKGGADPDSNVVDVYVRYLRNKLGRDPDLIRTVRGGGYVLTAADALQESATG